MSFIISYVIYFSAGRYSHSILDVTKASFIIRDKSCFLYHLVRTPRDGQERRSRLRSGPVPRPQPVQHSSAWGLLTSLNFSFLARCTEHCQLCNHETFPTRNLIQSASGSGRVCSMVLLFHLLFFVICSLVNYNFCLLLVISGHAPIDTQLFQAAKDEVNEIRTQNRFFGLWRNQGSWRVCGLALWWRYRKVIPLSHCRSHIPNQNQGRVLQICPCCQEYSCRNDGWTLPWCIGW